MSDLDLSLKITGDSKDAEKAVVSLDHALKDLIKDSDITTKSLDDQKKSTDQVAASTEVASEKIEQLSAKKTGIKELGSALKSLGGDIASIGTSLTLVTAPFMALAGLGISNIFKLGEGDETGVTGSYKEFATVVVTLKDNFTELSVEIGTVLMPAVKGIAASLSNAITWFRNLDQVSKNMIITVGLIVSAIGPMIVVFGKLTTLLGTMMNVLPVVASGFKVILGAISPLGVAITALVGTLASLTSLFINLKQSGLTTFEALKEAGMLFATGFMNYVVKNILKGFDLIASGFQKVTALVSKSGADAIGTTREQIDKAITDIEQGFNERLKKTEKILNENGKTLGGALTFGFSDAVGELKDTFSDIFSGDVNLEPVKKPFQELSNASEEATKKLKEDDEKRKQSLIEVANVVSNNVTNGFMSMIDGSKSVADSVGDMARQIVNDLIRMMIQAQVTRAAMSAIGGGFGFSEGGAVAAQGFSNGGRVFGAGTTTSDSIPAWLSNGEYVIRASSVKKVGTGFLDYINGLGTRSTSLPRGGNGYAEGGMVSPQGQPSKIAVEIINSGGEKEVTSADYDPKAMVISIVMDDIGSNGPIVRGIGSNFGLKRRPQ